MYELLYSWILMKIRGDFNSSHNCMNFASASDQSASDYIY